MSTILLLVAGKEGLKVTQPHFREVMAVLQSCVSENKTRKPDDCAIEIDGGYLIVDTERKTIVSRQDCFAIMDAVPRDAHWNVVDLLL